MIDRQGAKIVWECDSCDTTFESEDHESFEQAWPRAKREGWRARLIGKDEWVHGCPICGVWR